MAKAEMFDYWEVNPKDQTAILGEFQNTTTGILISMIIFQWTKSQGQEITSFRITPKASLKIVVSKTTSESSLQVCILFVIILPKSYENITPITNCQLK